MKLRPYQIAARQACIHEWEQVNSTLVVMPTGTGKTIFFADIINCAFPQRTLVVAHRQELIWQAKEKIHSATGLEVDVEMGEYQSQSDGLFHRAPVVVCTVQTLTAGGDGGGRIGKFDPMQFARLVIDEAHHAPADSYRRIVDYFSTNPNLRILGVTATPDRADEEALGQLFESVAFDYEILDAIHDGWLVPLQQQMVHSTIDFANIRTTAGDLNGADLASVMEAESALHSVASPTIEIIGDRRTLVFTSSVVHAQKLSEIFNRHRTGMSSWVCGKTPKDDRRQILADFSAGKIQVVCNCAVLTEGFDDPGVEVVVMARPTKSRSLYAQMCGRSTRPSSAIAHLLNDIEDAEGRKNLIASSRKPSCLIVDFVGNSGKHKLVTTADILGGKVSEAAIEAAIKTAMKAGRAVPVTELLDDEEEKLKEQEAKRLADEARRAKIVAKATYSKQDVDPFDVLQVRPVKPRGWDSGKVLSEPQKNFLRARGIDPVKLTFTAAKQLIGEIIGRFEKNLCTYKQAKILKRFGYNTECSFQEASGKIDALAKNGWRKPGPSLIPPPPPLQESPSMPADDDVPF